MGQPLPGGFGDGVIEGRGVGHCIEEYFDIKLFYPVK
jgi:hypothetical protein